MASLVLGASKPQLVDDERPCPRRPGRTAPSAGPGGSSSSGCAARSCGASGRGRRHRRASAATGSSPARARPVPFCFHGLAPPPRTSARVLVLCVPARRAASWAVTTWCITGHVRLDAEDRRRRARPMPASAPAGVVHGRPWPWLLRSPAFTASRTSTRPPFGPGTAPFTSSRSRSASACDDLEVQRGDLLAAHAAGHPRALEHPGRAWRRRRSSRARGARGGCRGWRPGR